MLPFFFDPTFLLLIPAILLAAYAQNRVRAAFEKYKNTPNTGGLTGAEAARMLLKLNGLNHIQVERLDAPMGDHYDPREKVVRLSAVVFDNASVTSMGIAAHEVGHALQHSEGYLPLNLRNSLFPVARLGSSLAFPLLFFGLIASIPVLIKFGIYAFLAFVVFQVVTCL